MIGDLQIELAGVDDAATIAEMSRSEIEYGLPWSWTTSRVLRLMRDEATNVVVVRRCGGFAGFGIMKYGDERAHLLLFAVHAAHRRAGVGTALLEWLEAVARVAGISVLSAEARLDNANGIAFYRAQGYAVTARVSGMYQGTLAGVRLSKRLHADLELD